MMLHWAGWPVGWWSNEDGRVRCRRVVGVQEDGRVALGQAGFQRDDPCEAGCLGDHEGDEDYVFHIGVVVCAFANKSRRRSRRRLFRRG